MFTEHLKARAALSDGSSRCCWFSLFRWSSCLIWSSSLASVAKNTTWHAAPPCLQHIRKWKEKLCLGPQTEGAGEVWLHRRGGWEECGQGEQKKYMCFWSTLPPCEHLPSSTHLKPRNVLRRHGRAQSLCIYFIFAAVNTPVIYLFKERLQRSAVHVFHQPSLAKDACLVKINKARGHEGQNIRSISQMIVSGIFNKPYHFHQRHHW